MMDLILGVMSGGATGLIGSVLSGGVKFFTDRQNQKHELAKMGLELQHMDKEAEIARDIKELDMEGAEAAAAWKGLEASYAESGKRWSTGDSGWIIAVDVVRGMMRPLLTLALVGVTTGIYFTLGDDSETLQERIIATILYLTALALSWWFADRQITKKLASQL
jgi:hypothetical protein